MPDLSKKWNHYPSHGHQRDRTRRRPKRDTRSNSSERQKDFRIHGKVQPQDVCFVRSTYLQREDTELKWYLASRTWMYISWLLRNDYRCLASGLSWLLRRKENSRYDRFYPERLQSWDELTVDLVSKPLLWCCNLRYAILEARKLSQMRTAVLFLLQTSLPWGGGMRRQSDIRAT